MVYVTRWFDIKKRADPPIKSAEKKVKGANYDKYTGTWDEKKNVPHGRGVYTWYYDKDKDKSDVKEFQYAGNIKYGKQHGRGLTTKSDGSMVQGNYKDGKLHGKAIKIGGDNSYIFRGQFENSKKQGYGTFTYPNGDKSGGNYKDNNKHGMWRTVYADGTSENTWFKDGIPSGKHDAAFAA